PTPSLQILPIFIPPTANGNLRNEFDSTIVTILEQEYSLAVLEMVSHCPVSSLEPHVTSLAFTGVVEDLPLPIILVAELLTSLSSENENVRVLARRTDPTTPLSAIRIVDFLSTVSLTLLERRYHSIGF